MQTRHLFLCLISIIEKYLNFELSLSDMVVGTVPLFCTLDETAGCGDVRVLFMLWPLPLLRLDRAGQVGVGVGSACTRNKREKKEIITIWNTLRLSVPTFL